MSLPGVRNLEPLARRAAPVIPPATTVGELWDRPPLGTHDRTVARLPIARTRQVTVSKIICGVDVSSRSLQARIGPDGVSHFFANTSEGIAELAQFCRQHGVELVAMEATGGYEKQSFAQLWAQGLAVAHLYPPLVPPSARKDGLPARTGGIEAGPLSRVAPVETLHAFSPPFPQLE